MNYRPQRSGFGMTLAAQATKGREIYKSGLPEHSLFCATFIIFPRERGKLGDHLERAAFCQRASRSRDRSRPNAIAKPALHVVNCASENSRHCRAHDTRRQNCSHSPGTHPHPAGDLGNAVWSNRQHCSRGRSPRPPVGNNGTSCVARTSRGGRLRAL